MKIFLQETPGHSKNMLKKNKFSNIAKKKIKKKRNEWQLENFNFSERKSLNLMKFLVNSIFYPEFPFSREYQ
jgi:hypothetical protein